MCVTFLKENTPCLRFNETGNSEEFPEIEAIIHRRTFNFQLPCYIKFNSSKGPVYNIDYFTIGKMEIKYIIQHIPHMRHILKKYTNNK